MSIEIAIKSSTGFVNVEGIVGYLTLSMANYLVGTGKYVYHQVTTWGYVVKKI